MISQTQADPSDPSDKSDKSDSTPSKSSLKGGFGRVLLQNHINQGSNVAHVHFAIAIDVTRGL